VLHEQAHRNGSMLDRDGKVTLAHSVFVDHEVFAANIWNEIPVWILNEQLECHRSGSRIIVKFGFLGACAPLKSGCDRLGMRIWLETADAAMNTIDPAISSRMKPLHGLCCTCAAKPIRMATDLR